MTIFHITWLDTFWTDLVYIPHFLYPFICQWTRMLLSYHGHLNNAAMNVEVQIVISFPLGVYPEVGLLGHLVVRVLIF